MAIYTLKELYKIDNILILEGKIDEIWLEYEDGRKEFYNEKRMSGMRRSDCQRKVQALRHAISK